MRIGSVWEVGVAYMVGVGLGVRPRILLRSVGPRPDLGQGGTRELRPRYRL